MKSQSRNWRYVPSSVLPVPRSDQFLQITLKLKPKHQKARKKMKAAKKALDEKVEAFKTQIDEAIDK